MELLDLLNWLFDKFGAAALPYTVIAFLGWLVWRDRNAKTSVPKEYVDLIEDYHDFVVKISDEHHDSNRELIKSIEGLRILLDERTRRKTA